MSNETVLLAKHNIFTLALMVSSQKIFIFLKFYPKTEMGWFVTGAGFWELSHRGNQVFIFTCLLDYNLCIGAPYSYLCLW